MILLHVAGPCPTPEFKSIKLFFDYKVFKLHVLSVLHAGIRFCNIRK